MRNKSARRRAEYGKAVLESALVSMPPEVLAREADSIVVGTVTAKVETGLVKFPALEGEITYTDHFIQVDHYLKSPMGQEELLVRTLGGTVEGLSIDAPDEPEFTPGERVVLFLCKDTGELFDLPEEGFTVLGLFQGKYTVIDKGESVWAPHLREPTSLSKLADMIGSAE